MAIIFSNEKTNKPFINEELCTVATVEDLGVHWSLNECRTMQHGLETNAEEKGIPHLKKNYGNKNILQGS